MNPLSLFGYLLKGVFLNHSINFLPALFLLELGDNCSDADGVGVFCCEVGLENVGLPRRESVRFGLPLSDVRGFTSNESAFLRAPRVDGYEVGLGDAGSVGS